MKLLQRCLVGAPIGLLVCQMISIVISVIIHDGTYYAVVPELIPICKSEVNAVIVQTVCALLYGSVWAGSSVIWEIDEWSLLKQSSIHFLITSIVTFPVAYMTRWMQHTISGIVSYFGIFVTIYVFIWITQYFSMKSKIAQLNSKVKENSERYE